MAQRESGYVRLERDAYFTPGWVTNAAVRELLGTRLRPGMTLWEPAAGNGMMVAALEAFDLRVVASDIQPDLPSDLFACPNRVMTGDFLDTVQPFLPFAYDGIWTNPPYKDGLAERFVRRALELTEPTGGIVAMLLSAKFDCAKTRRDIFDAHPAWGMKITLVDRIWWFEPKLDANGKVNGPSEDHCWYIWDWSGALRSRPMRYAAAPVEVLAEIRAKTRALRLGKSAPAELVAA